MSQEVESASITRPRGSSNDPDSLQVQPRPSVGILPSATGFAIHDGNVVGICGDSYTAARDVHFVVNNHFRSSRSSVHLLNENQEPECADTASLQIRRGMSSEDVTSARTPLPIQRSCDIYKRHLEAKGRGKCLWIPEPSKNLPIQYQRNGIAIGDVGIIHPSGRFIFLFNICLHKGESPNPSKMPTGFEPLSSDVMQELNISVQREFKENSFLASVSNVRVKSDGDSTGLVFESSEEDGAILTMPVGAKSEDLENVVLFRKYVSANLASWYRYAYHDRGFEVRNGDLRVVLGSDKTSSWGMATFSKSGAGCSGTGQESSALVPGSEPKFHLEFGLIGNGNEGSDRKPKRYGWEYSGVAEVRAGPDAKEIVELRGTDGGGRADDDDDLIYENQCLFVRTLNTTLSKRLWEDLQIDDEEEVDLEYGYGHHSMDGNPTGGTASPSGRGGNASSGSRVNQGGNFGSGTYYNQAVISTSSRTGNIEPYRCTTPSYSSSISLADHPSNAINDFLLNNCSGDPAMAISVDQDWISVLREDDHVLPSSQELLERIKEAYDICEEDNIVFLSPKGQNLNRTFPKSSSIAKDNIPERRPEKAATFFENLDPDLLACKTPHLSASVSDHINENVQPVIGGYGGGDRMMVDSVGGDGGCGGGGDGGGKDTGLQMIVEDVGELRNREKTREQERQRERGVVLGPSTIYNTRSKARTGAVTGSPRGRGAYTTGCNECNRKKIKCDGIKPICQQCTQGEQECGWTKNSHKPRTKQHFEELHKRAKDLTVRVEEYERYTNFLESLLDQCQQDNHHHRAVDFRASRPSETDGRVNSSADLLDHDFNFTVLSADDPNELGQEGEDPTKEMYVPPQSLKIEEGGLVISDHLEISPSRFPALAENPDATYVLVVDGLNDQLYNPDFDWSRHLPSSVPLDRRSHDRALDLLFKFFTPWCFRIVPALFLRGMYRALSVPASQTAPNTPHYSPMLHNALVALALALLDDHKFREFEARQCFANTAKSFIEVECQKPNLSVVHGLSILASFHSSQGEQTLGYLYFGMSARMSQALGLNVDCSEWVKLGLMDESDRLNRHWTNWTTLTQDVCWSLDVGRDFCVRPPPESELSLPFVNPEYDQTSWVYKPSGLDPQPNYITKTFAATCELLVISRRILDVVDCLNNARRRPAAAIDHLIKDIDLMLSSWKGNLSPELEVTVKSRPRATPHNLMLHLTYWWLLILLHRPLFHLAVDPIHSTDREINHDKICRRAAENIMELLATWRFLYSLRYCPINLVQIVFSAGTVYHLRAVQAATGKRLAQKELRHSLDQQELVMTYLHEIGRSWKCATNIADILKALMHEQLRPLLERKTVVPFMLSSGKLQLPEFSKNDNEQDQEDSDVPATLSRSSSKGHVRRQLHFSPFFTPSSTTVPTVSSPINIQTRPEPCTSSFSSSPSSLPDPWVLLPMSVHTGSPSPSSSPVFTYSASSFTSHHSPTVPAFSHSSNLSNADNSRFSFDDVKPISHIFQGQGILFGQSQMFNNASSSSESPAPSHQYPGKELAGFPGMLGGQTLPEAPFVGPFSFGDSVGAFGTMPWNSETSFSPEPASLSESLSMYHPTAVSAHHEGPSMVDNDTDMEDNTTWDMWTDFES